VSNFGFILIAHNCTKLGSHTAFFRLIFLPGTLSNDQHLPALSRMYQMVIGGHEPSLRLRNLPPFLNLVVLWNIPGCTPKCSARFFLSPSIHSQLFVPPLIPRNAAPALGLRVSSFPLDIIFFSPMFLPKSAVDFFDVSGPSGAEDVSKLSLAPPF